MNHTNDAKAWYGESKDWLFDGHSIKGEVMLERWEGLDWSRAYMDMGPSPAGNPGPYWHVPYPPEETVHRLYPKVLQTKWLPLITQAVAEKDKRIEELEAALRGYDDRLMEEAAKASAREAALRDNIEELSASVSNVIGDKAVAVTAERDQGKKEIVKEEK